MQRVGLPRIAIIDPNALSVLGLKSVLEKMAPMPMFEIVGFGTFEELEANQPDLFVHYFVAAQVVLEHVKFFRDRLTKTIVLTMSPNTGPQLGGFHTFCTNQPEDIVIKRLLQLEQRGHRHGHNLPALHREEILSPREIEVLKLIVEGNINKEIAEKLNIGLATVVTHRKNIMEKLNAKSVSTLTVYAVLNGYVNIDDI